MEAEAGFPTNNRHYEILEIAVDLNQIPTMPTDQTLVQTIAENWTFALMHGTQTLDRDVDTAYVSRDGQMALAELQEQELPIKPQTPRARNFLVTSSGSSTHRPIGGEHDHLPDRRARGFRRQRLGEIDLSICLGDAADRGDD